MHRLAIHGDRSVLPGAADRRNRIGGFGDRRQTDVARNRRTPSALPVMARTPTPDSIEKAAALDDALFQ